MHLRTAFIAGTAVGALAAATAVAQTQPTQQQQQPTQQQAQPKPMQQQPAQQRTTPAQSERPAQQQAQARQCLNELQALNNQMHQDGYWLTGWGTRWGGRAEGPAATGPATTGTQTPGREPAAVSGSGPWGARDRFGIDSPRYQIRILHGAANVLAHRGDQQACSQVLSELREIYTGYVGELRQAGVEPGQVTTWRQSRIVAAQPVNKLRGSVSVDDVTGTEVRNAQDERLGSIHDVVMDPQSGQISHALVARGGFFGIGADYVVVPWQAMRATPDLNLFVLNVQENVMEQAPAVERGQIGDHSAFEQQRQQADQYWRKHTAG